jgi:two-component system response regulator YesN
MYRFLMVDDEEIVRRGFETRIDWAAHGFEFLPPCEDGREAMKAVDELDPDVVMTDICMPHEDGISLAAWIAERRPDIVVVVLSGYDEFGYAQAAIRHHVFDYVLKPVSAKDLSSLLHRLRGRLDAEARHEAAEAGPQSSGRNLLRERNLLDWLSGASPAPTATAFAALYGFDPSNYSCLGLVVDVEGGRGAAVSEPGLPSRLASALGASRQALAFAPAEHGAGALLFDIDARAVSRAAEAVAGAFTGKAGEPVYRLGMGRAYTDWVDAPRAWNEARSALAYRLVRPAGEVLRYKGARDEDRDVMAAVRALEERWRLAAKNGSGEAASALGLDWIGRLDEAELSPQRLRHEAQSAFARLFDDFAEFGLFSSPVGEQAAGDSKEYWYNRVSELDTREGIAEAIADLAVLAETMVETRMIRNSEWKILDFKELVSRRYRERSFSIALAAERLGISESWLSKLLRRNLDTSFVDYLAAYRVERAKELLASSDMMAYEVAEAVGVPDARYFSTIFKRHAGMTPSEFKAGGAPSAAARDGS